jgi:hypothetical protein
MVPIIVRGLGSAGRLLVVSIRAVPWGSGAALVVGLVILLRRSGALQPHSATGRLAAAAMLVALLGLLVSVPVSWVRVFPLPAVLLEESHRSNAELVRRARELTLGRRWRVSTVVLVGVLFAALAVTADLPNMHQGGVTHPVLHVVVMLNRVMPTPGT